MSYINVYPARINWENEPSINTPINEVNLNKMDYALYSIDQTLANWDTAKANQSDLLLCVKSITYDTDTGVFVFTWQNGTTQTVDLNIEKIPVSFSMDANGVITMTTEDGTTYTADVGALIKTYTFTDSSMIDFTVTTDASGNKTVTADIVDGSITGTKLQPNYLADCQTAATNAGNSANAASGSASDSEAWAVGTRGGVPVPSSDPAYENNSYYWSQHGGNSFAGLSDVDMTGVQNGDVFVYDSSDAKLKPGNVSIDIDSETPTFTEASTRANIASGETISTLFGKIKKWFSDLKSGAFTDVRNDLTGIDTTGATNTTGSTINAGTYFYLDGVLVRAKADIANGATFTLNTNYEVVTAGALNELSVNYSTTERQIGTWIDGKPIYQKVLQVTLPSTGTQGTYVSGYTAIGATVGVGIRVFGIINNEVNGIIEQYVILPFETDNVGVQFMINPNTRSTVAEKNTIRTFNSNPAWNGKTAYVVVEYTKS